MALAPSLRTWLPLGAAGAGVLLLALSYWSGTRQDLLHFEEEVLDRSRVLGTLLSSQLETSFASGQLGPAQNFLSHACAEPSLVGAHLVAPDRVIQLSSSFRLERRPVPPRLSSLLGSAGETLPRDARWRSGDALVTAHPVRLSPNLRAPSGILLLEWDLAQGRARLEAAHGRRLGYSLLVLLALVGLVWLLLRKLWLRRVTRLVEACEQIGRGAASDALILTGEDELAQISRAMQAMVDGLAATEARLEQAKRLEFAGKMASGVAHDFNNLLMVIQGNADLLKALGELKPELLQAISQAAQVGGHLSRGLLTLTHKDPVQLEPQALDAAVEEAVELVRPLLPNAVKLRLDLDSSLTCRLSRGALTQVVLNLCLNARDALLEQGGGVIDIVTQRPSSERRRPDSIAAGTWAALSVRDDGPGIRPEDRERVFELFHSTKGRVGTGLGLAIVHEAVAAHGGHLELLSTCRDEPAQAETGPHGTQFRVWLPALDTTPASPLGPASPLAAEPPREALQLRVLVVEDQALVRRLTEEYFGILDFEVTSVADAEEGLERLERERFDVLLTDYNLPGMNGRQLIDQIRARGDEKTLAIISSGSFQADPSQQAREERTLSLPKPYQLDDLRVLLEEAGLELPDLPGQHLQASRPEQGDALGS